MNLVWFILIGILAGWLAGQIMGGGGYGLLGDLILGVIGAAGGRLPVWSLGNRRRRFDRGAPLQPPWAR